MKVLLLGGTAEARALASQLVDRGERVVTSLAGRVNNPALPAGEVRIGGFGGVRAMTAYLRDNACDIVIDATHPFAQRISANAAQASRAAGVPMIGLRRPAWQAQPGDRWIDVPSIGSAADAIPASAQRVFLTTGRQDAHVFASHQAWFLIRVVDPPDGELPNHHRILRSRGPYRLDDELTLLRDNRIDALVTKNSGGAHTYPKIEAARACNIPVVMVARPPTPTGIDYVAEVSDVLERLSTLSA